MTGNERPLTAGRGFTSQVLRRVAREQNSLTRTRGLVTELNTRVFPSGDLPTLLPDKLSEIA